MRQVKLPGGHRPILYGEVPFGWCLSEDRSGLVKDEDEQRILSVVKHMYMVERIPMRLIVERLRRMRVVNRRGRPFGLSGVWEMVHRRGDAPPESKLSSRKRTASSTAKGAKGASSRRVP